MRQDRGTQRASDFDEGRPDSIFRSVVLRTANEQFQFASACIFVENIHLRSSHPQLLQQLPVVSVLLLLLLPLLLATLSRRNASILGNVRGG